MFHLCLIFGISNHAAGATASLGAQIGPPAVGAGAQWG
jgi:hypothetical protein